MYALGLIHRLYEQYLIRHLPLNIRLLFSLKGLIFLFSIFLMIPSVIIIGMI